MEQPGYYHELRRPDPRMDPRTLADGYSTEYDVRREQRPYWTDPNTDRDEVLQMQKRISMLERQLASSAKTRAANQNTQANTLAIDPSQAIEDTLEDRLTDSSEQQRFIPQIVKRSWKEFTNKYADHQQEYAIELLMRDTDLLRHPEADSRASKGGLDLASTNHQEFFHKASEHIPKVVPARARINSPWILRALAKVDPEIDQAVPLVMLRPWKFLAHNEQKIRDIVQEVTKEDDCNSSSSTTASDATIAPKSSAVSKRASATTDDSHCQSETRHLQCLITLLDEYVKPMRVRFEGTRTTKVKFEDLWFLFKPGDDIYMPIKVRGRILKADAVNWTAEAFHGRYERMWRVTATTEGFWNPSTGRASHVQSNAGPFLVSCYYIDFDGRYFLPVTHTFEIMPFEGEEEITSLDFYPVRYVKDSSQVVDSGSRQGQTIFESLSRRSTHYYYTGPTLVAHPCGCPIEGDTLNEEHIESEVIVDFATSLLSFPTWRHRTSHWKPPFRPRRHEESVTRYWLDRSQQTSLGEVHDRIYDDYSIDLQRAIAFREQELIFAPIPSEWLSNRSRVPEKDVILLTYRGFAFVLKTRTFAPISLWHLHEILPQADGLRNLQLKDNSIKEQIRALVRTHFRHEETKKTVVDLEYGIVRGKGKGLVILLHGAPGVGKSSTAESVAAANGRPLFQITCGDLGLTPKEVETALKEIFRYAQMWRCILLLDECDIFLAARTKNDIQRNSLVSVFLRLLEFYSGVLFLTTNRVGVLDDAVRSRITWTIYYPPLDKEQTRMIWKNNLDLLAERNKDIEIDRRGILKFARDYFRDSTEGQPSWNGRQIQNAFRVATAFAEWEVMTDEERYSLNPKTKANDVPTKIQLQRSHFERIAAGILAFDKYILEVTGTSEAQRAWNQMERADDFRLEDHGEEIGNAPFSPTLCETNQRPWSDADGDRQVSITSAAVQTKGSSCKTRHSARSGELPRKYQVSQYLLSPPERDAGIDTSALRHNKQDLKLSKTMLAEEALSKSVPRISLKRQNEAEGRASQTKLIPDDEPARWSSIDATNSGHERDAKRQRLYGRYVPTEELIDDDELSLLSCDDE